MLIIWLALLAFVALAGLAYVTLVTPVALRRTRIDAPIAGLAPELEGYTIAVLSDLHYGGTIAPARLIARAVLLANENAPDLTVLLGDYALSHTRLRTISRWLYEWALPRMTTTLRALRARDGVVAILGNHDYDHNATKVVEWLKSTGARVLVNDCAVIARGDARLGIGGVDDWTHGRIDPAGGCASLAPDIPRVVLSHNPDGALALAPGARVDLVIAGHTHGGQIVLPWLGAPSRHCTVCDASSASGWVARSPVPLYVTTGVGVVLPLRINCPAEVLVIRLVRA
ncbi:MAG: metallophosphoesterase [Gemmatimonadota bacterium]|nr:metallophosphoesterase [Gemmatimonadota bacterium]